MTDDSDIVIDEDVAVEDLEGREDDALLTTMESAPDAKRPTHRPAPAVGLDPGAARKPAADPPTLPKPRGPLQTIPGGSGPPPPPAPKLPSRPLPPRSGPPHRPSGALPASVSSEGVASSASERAPSAPPRPRSQPPRPLSRPPSRPFSRPPLALDDAEIKSVPPPDIPGPEAFGDFDAPTRSAIAPRQYRPVSSNAPYPEGPGDDGIDLAKTQKLDRSDRVIAAIIEAEDEDTFDSDAPSALPHPEEPGHSGIPMAQPPRKRDGQKRRKSRKGKRRMVKIPDDSIPATPAPPLIFDEDEDDDESDPGALADPITMPAPPSEPAPRHVTGPPDRRLANRKVVEQPLGMLMEMEDEKTLVREPDEMNRLVEEHLERTQAAAISPDREPPLSREEVEGYGTRQSGPGIFTDDAAIMVLRPIEVTSDLPALQSEEPVEVDPEPDSEPSQQVPPTPPPARASGDALGRKLPPPRTPSDLDEIEEVVPERMSLPAFTPETADALASGHFEGKRRPPPPPARVIGVADATGQQQAISVDDLERLSTDPAAPPLGAAQPPPSATPPGGLTVSTAEMALAEARVREAEARATEAAAKARAAQAAADAAARQSDRPPKKPWWAEMFDGDLVRTLDNPKKRDVENEATFIEKSLRLDKGARILDLGCGTGVHAVELSSRGYQVVGVDLSNTMLDLARNYNTQRGTAVSFIQGDMRQLNLEGVFDAIYCWSATFGYFDDSTNAQVLERVARALRPGGTFVLDVPNRDFIAPRSPSMAWFDKPGCVCMDEMKFDYYTSRLITKRMVLFDNGRSREIESTMRLYTLHELGRLMQKVGFKVLEVSGHRAHRGAYFGNESPRMIISTRRPDDESVEAPSV